MKLTPKLYLTSLLAILLLLLAACGSNTSADTTTAATEPPAQTEETVILNLIKDGTTDYTIVYDDKSEAATALVKTVRSAFTKRGADITAVAASSAEADYGKEIVIGNVRASAAAVASKMKTSDFAMCVSGDDWVFVATNEVNYSYLALVAKERLNSEVAENAFTVSSEKDLICSNSAYADVPYAAYVKRNTRALSQEQVEDFFTPKNFSASNNTRLPYQLYLPSNYDPAKQYPVLVFLHGAGERGRNNDKQLVHVIANLFNQKDTPVTDAIVICPQCPDGNQWVDTPWSKGSYSTAAVKESNEAAAVVELVDKIAVTYSTDPDRYYIMGISMGGFGTWDIIMRHSDKFAAAVPICGGADPSMAESIKNVPIYTTHSDDDPTVPASGTHEMVEALQAAGSTVLKYDQVTGKGHGVWDSFTQKTEVLEWLFAQKLSDRKS